MGISNFKKYLLILIPSCFFILSGHSQNNKDVIFRLSNTKVPITDTLSLEVGNTSKEAIKFTVAIEVQEVNQWKELYSDIFEFNRNKIHRHTVLSGDKEIYKFPINHIHTRYQKLLNNWMFRLRMVIYPRQPLQDVRELFSNSFTLNWI